MEGFRIIMNGNTGRTMFALPANRGMPYSIGELDKHISKSIIHSADVIVGPDGDTVKDRFNAPFKPWNPGFNTFTRMGVLILPVIDTFRSRPGMGWYVDVFDYNERAEELEGQYDNLDAAILSADSICSAFGGTAVYEHAIPGKMGRVFTSPASKSKIYATQPFNWGIP